MLGFPPRCFALNVTTIKAYSLYLMSIYPPYEIQLSKTHAGSQCRCSAAAKSLQLCPTLCDPMDGSPPGSPVPGKNTGVGYHFLLQCMKVKRKSEVAQSCLTLSIPMDCSPPGSSVHGIFQARVLEWESTGVLPSPVDVLVCPNLLGICALLGYLYINLNLCHDDSKFRKRQRETKERENERYCHFCSFQAGRRGNIWLSLFPSEYFKYLILDLLLSNNSYKFTSL